MSRSSLALVNPRAVVILIVLALHSALPYLASLPPSPYPFDSVHGRRAPPSRLHATIRGIRLYIGTELTLDRR